MMKYVGILLLLCAGFLSAEEILGVHYNLDSEGTKWKKADSYKNDEQEVISYLLENEQPTEWTELFTVQSIKGINKTPSEFYQLFIDQIKVLAPVKNVQSKILQQEPNELLGEWWIADKSTQDQHEWVRIVGNNQGDLVVLRFTTRKMDQIEQARKKAETMLQPQLVK